jgi:hypothetical protein
MIPEEAVTHPLGKALSAVMRRIDYDYLTAEDYPELVTILQQTLADMDAGVYRRVPNDDPGWDW